MTRKENLTTPGDAVTIVRDYLEHKGRDGSLRESFLETALYLEDALRISLDDDDLTPERLGDEEAILRLVTRKLDGGA